MNAHVKHSAFNYYTPQQRAAQVLDALRDGPEITREKVVEFHHCLSQIFLRASHCAAICNEILEGCGNDELSQKMLIELGNIKSNLIFIGAVVNGKK